MKRIWIDRSASARRHARPIAGLLAALVCVPAVAQFRVSPEELARLRVEAAAQHAQDAWPELALHTGPPLRATLSLAAAATPDRTAQDFYVGLQPANNGFWRWTWGQSEVAYWALDDGAMGPAIAAVGGGRVTQYEFSFGLHADFANDTLRPYVIVSFWNAPPDPVAQATNPVVNPNTSVSSIAWLFDPITLASAGFYSVRTGLIDLAALGLDFNLDETFYVEILPAEWSSYPNGAPVIDPDVHAIFTGPGTVTYGTNQNRMWSDFWVRDNLCSVVLSNGNGDYDHPAEMDTCNHSWALNQSGIILRGVPCTQPTLALTVSDTCVRPGELITVVLSQSCLGGYVRGYQAFLAFDPNALTLFQGTYITPLPYGLPIITPITAINGEINLAAGIDDEAGQSPTTASADLVTLKFTAGSLDGSYQVVFRPHDPPTRFSDPYGQEVVPLLINSPTFCIDGTPPTITCPPDVNVPCFTNIPAPATNYDEFVAQGGTASDGGCCGPAVTVEHVGDTNNGGTGCPSNPYIVWRRYRATDTAGNSAECVQTITVADTVPPTVSNCPPNQTVTPPAPACQAVVTWSAPTVSDNCGGSVSIEYRIDLSDNGSVDDTITTTSYTFPVGTHRVIVAATDVCGNVNTNCSFLVTVNAWNELVATLELRGVSYNTFDRCVVFELNPGNVTVQQVVTFTNGRADNVLVQVPCGSYDCIRARDPRHSLWAAQTPAEHFGIVGTQYVANFTDDLGPDNRLVLGNLNQDQWVDILDFGVYVTRFGQSFPVNLTCSYTLPHPDFDGSGLADTADFTVIQTHFLMGDDTGCGAKALLGNGPLTRVAEADLAKYGLSELASADLNGDGWLDEKDMAAFLGGSVPEPPPPAPILLPKPVDVPSSEARARLAPLRLDHSEWAWPGPVGRPAARS